MNPWIYQPHPDKPVKIISSLDDIPGVESKIGFVYVLTDKVTKKIYVGKKVLYHRNRKKISQREKKQTGTRKKFKETIKESNWLSYHGSCKEIQEVIKIHGEDRFERQILQFSCSTKQLSYLEVKWQFKLEVLEKESYNGNIAGKFFRKDISDC